MSDDAYAIVIDVGPAQPNCLIDIPFDDNFKKVSRAIQNAANNLGLRHVRTDSTRKGRRFPQEIIELTRSARLVVAVCAPHHAEGPRAAPNPNVMYELGLAHGLGKPTLILTTDGNTLPADIRDFSSLQYQPAESESALAAKVENEMRRILEGMANPLTHPDSPNVWAARASQRMLLKPSFWKSFRLVLRYAINLRNEMESLSRELMQDIERCSRQLVDDDFRSVLNSFRKLWHRYEARYNDNTAEALDPPSGLRLALRDIDGLAGGADAQSQVTRIDGYSTMVKIRVGQFRDTHQTTAKICDSVQADPSNDELRARLGCQVSQLAYAVRELVDYSGALVDNLVNMVATGFDGPETEPPEHATVAHAGR